ncbi:chlorophyll A-B binding protein [Aureococcus anophagefferens]|uniref:Chlorophyll A-B binding protein n=1 Tax=Aureococcus anophagefferens TaxID=44056 RepID=A0ABR1G277_AURAN|nr:chlorophyll A-B binding protein [Aureococcus anophagefferens]KAH8098249.1 chlorophyll A-B binding protein [Aureococcus anophagefferens]
MDRLLAASLVASAAAFGGVSPPVLKGVGITAPFGNAADGTCWDPVGFTTRTFPGNLATGVKFSDLAAKSPLEAWEATPFDGKVQILIAIGLAEFHSEFGAPYKTHYTKGGSFPGNQLNFLGDSKWEDVWGGKVISTTSAKTDAQFLNQQNAELNNGRLAMIGVMGFSAAALVPGSVPLLP